MARTTLRLLATLAAFSATTCVGTPNDNTADPAAPLEDSDPQSLAWVAPESSDVAPTAGDAIELTVSTQNAAAHVVHFTVDGAEVGVCDPSDPLESAAPDTADPGEVVDDPVEPLPSGGCHDGDVWRLSTTLDAAGAHTIGAWFADASGARVDAPARTITLADASSTANGASDEVESSPSLDDSDEAQASLPQGPTSSIDQATLSGNGYFDGASDFHAAFPGGRAWRVEGHRVVFRSGALQGLVETVARCERAYGDSIARYSDLHYVSRASVVAAAVAESNCTNGAGGPMRVPVSACVAQNRGLSRAECARRLHDSGDFAIEQGVLRLARVARIAHHDPPRTAAAYHTGAVRASRRDAWHMVAPRGYINAFVGAYNAYNTWEVRGSRLTSYTNTLLPPVHCPDPASLRVTDRAGHPSYYISCTACYTGMCTGSHCTSGCSAEEDSHAYPIWRSHDLVNWDQVSYIFPDGHRPERAHTFWAPDIHQVGDHFVAYYTVQFTGPHVVRRATAPRVEGPWTDLGTIAQTGDPSVDCAHTDNARLPNGHMHGANAYIDPNLLVSPEGNFLYYAIQEDTICVRRLDAAGTHFVGGPAVIALDHPTGWEASTVEGPWVVYNPDDHVTPYYMFYSGNDYRTNYQVGVARAAHPAQLFEREGAPILSGAGAWLSPGHNSVLPDTHGNDFIVYHAIRAENVMDQNHPEAHRWTLMDPLRWNPTTRWPELANGTGHPSASRVTLP